MNPYMFMIIIFGVTIGLWLVGFKSEAANLIDKYKDSKGSISIFDTVTGQFSSSSAAITTAGSVITAFVLSGGGNIFIVAGLTIALVAIDFFIFPISLTATNTGLPTEINILLLAFFKTMEFLAVLAIIQNK